MKSPTLLQDPSCEHLHSKLIIYMLCCILIGIALSIAFPDFNDDDKINRTRRVNNVRVFRPIRTLRTARRKAA